jgi:pyruvate dehydrogenase E2 component (dihydrolipoamide acetyltransferase)
MPVITSSAEEAVVSAWLVDEGGRVRAGQLIAEVLAEKVAMEVYASADGIVRGLVAINQPVLQGTPMCRIEEAIDIAVERVAASPAARRLASELGIDLKQVRGSSPGGRITEADVRAATVGDDGAVMSGLRAVIARNMRQSHSLTAPVTITTTADVTDTLPAGSVTAWVVQAVADTLPRHPNLNGQRDGDRYVRVETPRISVAVQTDEGLLAPVLKNPGGKRLEELAEEIAELAARARGKHLDPGDLEGGTFTVTNLGGFGIDAFTPLINLPQVAVLGVGDARAVPSFDAEGAVVRRRRIVLSLTLDHAFIDGAPAA